MKTSTLLNVPIGPNERFIALDVVRVHRLVGPAAVRTTSGTVWLTITGELDDHVLAAGDAVTLDAGREAWVQALEGRAGVVVTEPARSWPDATGPSCIATHPLPQRGPARRSSMKPAPKASTLTAALIALLSTLTSACTMDGPVPYRFEPRSREVRTMVQPVGDLRLAEGGVDRIRA